MASTSVDSGVELGTESSSLAPHLDAPQLVKLDGAAVAGDDRHWGRHAAGQHQLPGAQLSADLGWLVGQPRHRGRRVAHHRCS